MRRVPTASSVHVAVVGTRVVAALVARLGLLVAELPWPDLPRVDAHATPSALVGDQARPLAHRPAGSGRGPAPA